MKKIAVFVVMLGCLVSSVMAQVDLQPLVTVKLYKTESITVKQLKDRVETYKKQSGLASFTVPQIKEVLDSMIDEKLLFQAAQKAGLNISDSQVNEYFLESISQQVGQKITEKDFAALVKSQSGLTLDEYFKNQVGMTLKEYKAYLKNQLIAQQYVFTEKQQEIQLNPVSDAEIRSYFEINKSSFAQNDILKLFLVVSPKNKDSAGANKLVKSLLDDLKNKKVTFDQLKVRGQSKTEGFEAGDMYVSKGTLAAEQLGIDYEALLALFTQDIGYISEVKETPTDFQFYIVREKYPAKLLGLQDEVQPGTAVSVYEYIRDNLSQQKQSQAFASAIQEITKSLRTPVNFQMLKTGAALDKILTWK